MESTQNSLELVLATKKWEQCDAKVLAQKKCASAEDRTHDLRVHSATLYKVRHSLELRIINATRHIELASEHMHDMFHHIRNCPTLPANDRIFPGATYSLPDRSSRSNLTLNSCRASPYLQKETR